jgi:membrane associated rhomboid family serine protease
MVGINLLTYAAQMLTNGALTAKLMKSSWHIDRGELWRLITPVFLHADIFHLLINSYSLYNLGHSLEPMSGMPRFATIYFISTLAGNLCSYWMHQGNSVGASTALFGLLGAEAMVYLRNSDVFLNSASNLQNIALMVAINAAYGFSNPRIDNSGHFGGLVGGAIAAWLLGPKYVRGRWGRWEDRPPFNIFGKQK